MLQARCQLCNSQQWQQFTSICFGTWAFENTEIERDSALYPIGLCLDCGHVQVMSSYTPELFDKLYFHSAQESVMWHESLINDDSPYQDMINFAISKEANLKTVVDFGCGEGKLLHLAKQSASISKLVGIDFNDRFAQEGIDYFAYDLNNLSDLPLTLWPCGIDLAMASHVLEHVVDPVNFLKNIKSHLSDTGVVFVEVPDFTSPHELKSIGKSNLVNLQHIHYFSLASLTYAANQAGFNVVKSQQVTTGYIPRLQVMLKVAAEQNATISFNGTVKVISQYQEQVQYLRQQLAQELIETIRLNGTVGVWGVGADFYNLITEQPLLIESIKNAQIRMFDYELAGKTFCFQKIHSSTEIPEYDGAVYMSPILAETRVKMARVSKNWMNVRDIFK
ncbi:Methyltransferase type 12 [Shewanella denitrificans OS217]|uniref:Methyltransferase type 12 n=1 Tax=Shewanella denitrificans (strain OS217 / ATCC BAA-1090 / DSM 15013) TaxID=318161 RepID=Q12JJ4_SHEDO|nr:class I SAM-dependent methyltransferase [Shewanella denitrificans]ABE56382.1 Methyltransferase type 12 [Shewanella denitrificans OS217]